MTKIVLCGANGKMGHTLAGCIAKREDCTVIAGIDSYTKQYDSFPIVETAEQLPEQPDVIIDFSNPSSLDMLLNYAFTHHVALVLATTGYSEAQIAQIHTAAEQIPVFFTFNMSLGINLLVELAKRQLPFWATSLTLKSWKSTTIRKLMHRAARQSCWQMPSMK